MTEDIPPLRLPARAAARTDTPVPPEGDHAMTTRRAETAAILAFALVLILATTSPLTAQTERLIGGRFPALSPDGSTIAFSYLGDIWTVPASGGRATRITGHDAYEREPVWSPDGKWLAFTSDRFGNNDIFLVAAGGGEPRQITFHTGNDVAGDFSPDGKWIYFTSGRTSNASTWRIATAGGNPEPVLDTYWSWPYDPRIGPDGRTLLVSLGMENGSKWRRGYRGANSAKLWVKPLDQPRARLVFGDEANAFCPAWSPRGDRIFFTSDRQTGIGNLWSVAADGSDLKAVTRFREQDVRAFRVARNVPQGVFERDFGIWTVDLENGRTRAVPIEAPAELRENRSFFVANAPVSEYAVSPDGKKVATVVRGEIFVLSSEGGYARNITDTPARERDLAWDKESSRIIYVSDAGADPNLYIVSALGDEPPRRLTDTAEDVLYPQVSPDGKWIAYVHGKREIRVVGLDGKGDRLVIRDAFGGRFGSGCVWSPDSHFLAVVSEAGAEQNILAVEVESGTKTPLTNTAWDENAPVWSPDGKSLFFLSNRYGHSFPEFTGKSDVYRVRLIPRPAEFDETKFEELFTAADTSTEKKKEEEVTVALRLEDIDRQTETVADTPVDARNLVVSPKESETAYWVSNLDGTGRIWKATYKEGRWGRPERFAESVSNPGHLQFDAAGKYLYYTSGGRLSRIDAGSGRSSAVSFDTRIEVDRTADYRQMLAEVYYVLEHYYYDESHHDLDWKKTYESFLPVLAQVREDRDFYDYANEMIGRLNSSHTGISGPRSGRGTDKPSAHLGARLDFTGGRVTIGKVYRDGPLWDIRDRVGQGDVLLAIDGERVDPQQNIWPLLNGKVGRRVRLEIRKARGGDPFTVDVAPISEGAEKNLIREEWIDGRKAYVKEQTGDRVAYLWMAAMGQGDLTRFLKELERDAVPRAGLIMDVRWNMGGNIHDKVLDALTRPVYAKWRVRGMPETQQSTFGYADRPVVLLTNEVTLSDGEMTANGFKALQRGPIVGNTTYGWLIFTTSSGLLNGGSFRLPFWGCYTLDGRDLERIGGVVPDVPVVNDLNHELAGTDPQLDKAIEEALKRIK
jgi:tricorn protease